MTNIESEQILILTFDREWIIGYQQEKAISGVEIQESYCGEVSYSAREYLDLSEDKIAFNTKFIKDLRECINRAKDVAAKSGVSLLKAELLQSEWKTVHEKEF